MGGRCYNRLVGGKRTKPLLVLIDGHGIIHRAYHAVKVPLTVRSTGEVVTAVYGFANTLLSVFQELKPTHVAVVLDKGKPTLRIAKDATYKAHRPEMPDDLRVQIGRCRELIEAFDIPIYELEHYEADDVLGALARQAVEQGIETYLVSLDSDIAQLVQPNVHVYMYRPYQRDSVIYETPEDVQRTLRRLAAADARPQGPEGRHLGQHTGRARRGRQDGGEADPAVRQHGGRAGARG